MLSFVYIFMLKKCWIWTCAVLNPDPVLVKGKNLNNVARQLSCCTPPWACSCMTGWGGSPLQACQAEPCQGCCGGRAGLIVIVNAAVEGHVLPDQPLGRFSPKLHGLVAVGEMSQELKILTKVPNTDWWNWYREEKVIRTRSLLPRLTRKRRKPKAV